MIKKRVAAAILWTYFCWVAGGLAQFLVGTPAIFGLAVGVAVAAFFGLDPLRVVWPKARHEAAGVAVPPRVETGPVIGDALAH